MYKCGEPEEKLDDENGQKEKKEGGNRPDPEQKKNSSR